MIRLRAHALALCALVFLPALAPAATISVTTQFDEVADNDVCSLREAVQAAFLASRLSRRESASTALKTNREELEASQKELQTLFDETVNDPGFDPANIVYSRNELVVHLKTVLDEIDDYDPEYWVAANDPTKTLRTEFFDFQQTILAIGNHHGGFDFCTLNDSGTRVCAFPEGSRLQPGYYTYRDIDTLDGLAPVTVPHPTDPTQPDFVFSPDTNPADSIDNADRAYWDGKVWTKYSANQPIPVAVELSQLNTAINFFRRVEAATNSEVDRISALTDADGCSDGSSFDTVFLEDKIYYLNSEIEMPIRLTIKGRGKESVIERCVTGECTSYAGGAGGNHRFFTVPQGKTTEMEKITFRNGNADTADGGALLVNAMLNMKDVWFENNQARSGGAIHVGSTGSLDIERGVFTGNRATGNSVAPVPPATDPGHATRGSGGAISQDGVSVVLSDCTFGGFVAVGSADSNPPRNVAVGNGGAVAVVSAVSGSLKISGNAFVGNVADNGSALYLAGEETLLTIENTTFSRNRANLRGTVDISLPITGKGTFTLNNISMLENEALAGVGGIYVGRLLPVQVHNSIIAGNVGAGARDDCDFASGVIDPSRNFRRNYYSNTTGAAIDACPGVRHVPGAPVSQPEVENFEPGSGPGGFALFRDPAVPAQEALLNPMDATVGLFYVPIYPNDANDVNEIRLVNRGAAVQDEFRCAARDQRNHDRSSSVDEECDIGAVEFQIGRRSDDNVDMLVGERRCISVIADDLGDATYVPGSLRILDVERAGFNVFVVSRIPGSSPNVHPTLRLDDPAVCANHADLPAAFREAIVVEPAPGFRGQTNVVYGFDWQTTGTVPVLGSVTAIAQVRTESSGGITSSTLGSLPIASLLMLVLLGLRRMTRALLLPLLFMGFGGAVHAENVIYVNSSLDEPVRTTPGDGRCTLREAFESARNDRANLSGGDCNNGNEGPDVIEFVPGLTEVVLEDALISYGGVTLRCPTPPEPAAGQPRAEPQTCTIRRRAFELDPTGAPTAVPNPRSFRLIDSRGSLTVSRMTFEDGQAPDIGAGREGGAIYSKGSLSVFDSVFRNNVAIDGGAIFLSGANSSLSVTRSVFIGNASRANTLIDGAGNVIGMTPARRAACPLLARGGVPGQMGNESGGGGAIATSQSDYHRITVLASSFMRNCAAYGSAAVDLNSRHPIVIANSTFTENISFRGPGAVDVAGALGNGILRNVTVIGNRSGMSGHVEAWETVPTQRSALNFGDARVDMTSSIVAGNVTEADPSVAANCSTFSNAGMRRYNVYGDEDDNPATGVVTNGGHTCRIDPLTNDRLFYAEEVFDPVNPASGMLTPLVANKVGDTTLYLFEINDNPAARGVLIDGGYTEGTSAEESQVDAGFNQTIKCANVDARGASRASGERCDVGAFEVLGVTAKEDAGNNFGRKDRIAIVDLIANDVFDNISALPGRALKDNCTQLDTQLDTPVVGARTYRFVHPGVDVNADGQADVCAEVVVPASEYANPALGAGTVSFLRKGVPADDQLIGREPKSNYVMAYDNHGVLRDEDANLNGKIKVTYRAFSVDQTPTNFAEVLIGIDNVPPKAGNDSVSVGVGEAASVNVLVNDTDDDSSPASLKLINLSGTGCTARYATIEDEDAERVDHWRCQFGVLRLSAGGTTLTFTPTNSFNPFSQDVTYEITDQDPDREKTSKGSVRFLVGRPVANAGSILGQDDLSDVSGFDFLGAAGTAFFLPLLLAIFRRRTVH